MYVCMTTCIHICIPIHMYKYVYLYIGSLTAKSMVDIHYKDDMQLSFAFVCVQLSLLQ